MDLSWKEHVRLARGVIQHLIADVGAPGQGRTLAYCHLRSMLTLLEQVNEQLEGELDGEPPQEAEHVLGDPEGATGQRTGPAETGDVPAKTPASPEARAAPPSVTAPSTPSPALMAQLKDRCAQVFRTKVGGTERFSPEAMSEWFRHEFPGYQPRAPLSKQLTPEDVEECLDLLTDPARAKASKLQDARYSYRAARADAELLGLTTFALTVGLTPETLHRWTKELRQAVNARRDPSDG